MLAYEYHFRDRNASGGCGRPRPSLRAARFFARSDSNAWYAYSEVLLPPPGGPGPVQQDPDDPLVTNDDFRATGKQPTYPMGDVRSPDPEALGGRCAPKGQCRTLSPGTPTITQHAECRPGGVAQFLVQPYTRPMYIVQGRNEVLLINESFAEVRHIYLGDRHDPKPEALLVRRFNRPL